MSTIKADAITASTGTNTNIAITGKGTGKLKLGDGELLFPDVDGSANQYIKTDGSANLAFATLPVSDGSKAWHNYTTVSTTATNDSYNIASIGDTGAGRASHTYTNAFDSANMAAGGSGDQSTTQGEALVQNRDTQGSATSASVFYSLYKQSSATASGDSANMSMVFHGTLA